MVSFLYRMPAGIPGAVNRAVEATIETDSLLAGSGPTVYGVPLVRDAATGKARAVAAGDTAAMVIGMFARPYPTTGNGVDGLGVSTPPVAGNINRLTRGFMEVVVNGTTAPVKDGPVYMRVGGATSGKPIGGLEAAVDSTTASNTLLLPGVMFQGAPDANGNCEIRYNI